MGNWCDHSQEYHEYGNNICGLTVGSKREQHKSCGSTQHSCENAEQDCRIMNRTLCYWALLCPLLHGNPQCVHFWHETEWYLSPEAKLLRNCAQTTRTRERVQCHPQFVTQEWIKPVGNFLWFVSVISIPFSAWHCWMNDGNGIQPVKIPTPVIPDCFLRNPVQRGV